MAVTTVALYLCILLVNLFLFHITNVVAPPLAQAPSVIEVNQPRSDNNGSIVRPPYFNTATQTFSIQVIDAIDRKTITPSNVSSMGGVAIGVRPALSTAEAPVSTPGCNPSVCNIVFPVSRRNSPNLSLFAHGPIDCGRVLLAQKLIEHGLLFNDQVYQDRALASQYLHVSLVPGSFPQLVNGSMTNIQGIAN